MFKHYLTYQFAVSFHRSVCLVEAETVKKERLLRSAENMLHQFSRAIRTTDSKDELKFLCVALICLRDCKESLEELKALSHAISSEYDVLHGRLEQICAKASDAEGGQLRMLG